MGSLRDNRNKNAEALGKVPKPYSDVGTIIPPKTLTELTEKLRCVFASDEVNIEYVKALMESYEGNSDDWEQYALFDTKSYTRNLVDKGNGKFNLLILCWNKGQGSSIHSHANSHCFLKVLKGAVQEEMFSWPEDGKYEEEMKPVCVHTHTEGKCTYICDDIGLHRVRNPSLSEGTVTLHLYSPPFFTCKTFDEQTGKAGTAKMTFWSEYGKRTTSCEDGHGCSCSATATSK